METRTDWFAEVKAYLEADQRLFIDAYLAQGAKRIRRDKLGHAVDPCPFCGHVDCFKVRDGFVKCFNGGCIACDSPGYVDTIRTLVGGPNYIHELERFTGIPFRRDEGVP